MSDGEIKQSVPKIVNLKYKDPRIEVLEIDERDETVKAFIEAALNTADSVTDITNYVVIAVDSDGERKVSFNCGDIPPGYFGEYIKRILDSYQF